MFFVFLFYERRETHLLISSEVLCLVCVTEMFGVLLCLLLVVHIFHPLHTKTLLSLLPLFPLRNRCQVLLHEKELQEKDRRNIYPSNMVMPSSLAKRTDSFTFLKWGRKWGWGSGGWRLGAVGVRRLSWGGRGGVVQLTSGTGRSWKIKQHI